MQIACVCVCISDVFLVIEAPMWDVADEKLAADDELLFESSEQDGHNESESEDSEQDGHRESESEDSEQDGHSESESEDSNDEGGASLLRYEEKARMG